MTLSLNSEEGQPNQFDPFSATSWTVVMAALAGSPEAIEALERLCGKYWYPIYAYIRRRGHGPHDAEDLTQGFFFEVLNNKRLRSADRSKGKFRAYLLTAVNGYLANHWHFTRAAKRGGGRPIVSLNACTAEERFVFEPACDAPPETQFDQQWATCLVDQVRRIMEVELRVAGKAVQCELLGGMLGETPGDQASNLLAKRLGMSPNALAVTVHRLRQRFRKLLREEVARTVDAQEEIDDEMRYLLEVLAKA